MTYINFKPWTRATEELSWGVQSVLYNTLALAAEGKIRLSYGQDYVDGVPCLINSAGQMLKSGGGEGVPIKNFRDLVLAFDTINRQLNVSFLGTVHPLTAEILLHHAADLKEKPIEKAVNEATDMVAFENNIHREATDEEIARDWLNSLVQPAPNHTSLEQADVPVL